MDERWVISQLGFYPDGSDPEEADISSGSEADSNDASLQPGSTENDDEDGHESLPDLSDSEIDQEWEESVDGWLGKDRKTFWKKAAPPTRKRGPADIVRFSPGLAGPALQARNPLDFFKLFITPDIINLLVTYTNKKIHEKQANYRDKCGVGETNTEEMEAMIGLVLLAGLHKASKLHLQEFYATDGTGLDIFPAVMSLNRLYFLLRCLRFDDITTREERKLDKLSKIRELSDQLLHNCQQNYILSELVTIDEMLIGFRGRCNFRQYIRNKPAKYGIKIHALCDASNYYISKFEIYAGTQPDGPYKVDNSPSAVVSRLVSEISGSSRNVTFDNWYCSVPLVETLFKVHKLTAVGTLRRSKDIPVPPQFILQKDREKCSSLFGFQRDITLLSYLPKSKEPKKIVMMVSSFHHDGKIDESTGEQKKPEIITFYNKTKGGVDVADRMIANYNCSRHSRRWPLTLFYSFLNMAVVNGLVLYRISSPANELVKHREFLKEIAIKLVKGHAERRMQNTHISRKIKRISKRIFSEIGREGSSSSIVAMPTKSARGRCHRCERIIDRKCSTSCNTCQKFVCKKHSTTKTEIACDDCNNEFSDSE